jgi:RES domain-containing protein
MLQNGSATEWVSQQRSVVLSLPSVVTGERNYVLNPAHSAAISDFVVSDDKDLLRRGQYDGGNSFNGR